MVHNGIEYADMQLIAEAYDLLTPRRAASTPPAIAEIFEEWNTGDLESFLIEITAKVLRKTDATTGRPLVDVILDQAEQKGTGRWTAQDALELGVPLTGITEAVFARALSALRDERKAASTTLAGPRAGRRARTATTSSTTSAQALYASQDRRLRAGLRADARGVGRPTTGTSTSARWRRSGAAAASSARGSSTGSARPTPSTATSRTC